jgi:glycosyltransferase involved in cell wall biosynthesis
MLVIFIAPRFHTNQIGIVKSLIDLGHQVEFHVVTKGFTEDYSDINPIIVPEATLSRLFSKLWGYGGVNKLRYFPNPIMYWKLLKQKKPDLLIIRSHNIYFEFIASIIARLQGIKIFYYSQILKSDFHSYYENGFKSLLRKFVLDFKMFFFDAKFFSPLFCNINDFPTLPHYCFYLPFVVKSDVHNDVLLKHNVAKILMVAKFQTRKNHVLLLEALSEIKDNYSFDLTLVGEVTTPMQNEVFTEVKNKVFHLNLTNRVNFKLNVPFHMMESIYLDHDLFVLPATNEPASVSIIEALGYGLPVICSDTCGTSVFVKDEETGYIFENNSMLSLKSKIISLLNEPSKLLLLKKKVRLFAQSNFSPNVYYENFIKNCKP